jgi:enamine deaminase RidA (YjgF/YER057c/UK114 family)
MRKQIFSWIDREFIELSGEARGGGTVEKQTVELFRRFEEELKREGLSPSDIVRTRIWGRYRESRNLATAARAKLLAGPLRAASSSYISLDHFESNSDVALDLLAMRPSRPNAERIAVEFEPPRNYLCHIRYDSLAFFSGFTSGDGALEQQVPEVVRALAAALAVAGTNWGKVVKLSLFLHRSQKLETLRELLAKAPKLDMPRIEFGFVDGFAGGKSLLEAEATATV